MPTDRPTDAEVLAEALWLSRLLLSEPLYQGNGEESEVAEQAGQFLRQVADRLSAPSSEEDAKRYQTAPSVSSAGAGDTQIAEDAGILADIAERLRAEILHQAEDGADWYNERPNRMLLAVEMELDLEALARSALPLPAPPAQGKPE